jgi:hypothetical protein
MYNRIWTVLVTLCLLFALTVNASATEADPLPDLTRKGSLSFTMEVDGVPLDSGRLNLYHVATISRTSQQQYAFTLLDALAGAGATLDPENLYDGAQAQRLLTCAQTVFDSYLSKPIENGQVHFADLEAGLYLVWQRPEDASAGYDAIAPFLISIPKWQDGDYTFHVQAHPKVPIETEPTPPPPPPPSPPPDLPQTGQLNWPVPVMAMAGVTLLIVGWILCAGRKRCGHEK